MSVVIVCDDECEVVDSEDNDNIVCTLHMCLDLFYSLDVFVTLPLGVNNCCDVTSLA